MRRRGLALLIVFGMLTAACSAGDAVPSTDAGIPDGTTTSTTRTASETSGVTESTSDSAGSSTTAPPAPVPDPDRPLAPDFQLQLGNGELYQLAAETKPVYLVFWAEW